MILVIGEILFDIFPNSKRIGGAPFNFVFHLKKLGFPVRFVSRVGNDQFGEQILAFLADHAFDTDDIQIDSDHGTGYVDVKTESGSEHTFTIVPDRAYDHIDYRIIPERFFRSDLALIYFGSLIQRTEPSAIKFQKMMRQRPKTASLFCDINLRPDCYTWQTVKTSLQLSDFFKLNQEEFDKISSHFLKNGSLEFRANQLMDKFALKTIILTMGDQESHWFDHSGHHVEKIPRIEKIIDTVGAGDAYAAICAAGILAHQPVKKTTELACKFASLVCQNNGALIEDESIYQRLAKDLEIQ